MKRFFQFSSLLLMIVFTSNLIVGRLYAEKENNSAKKNIFISTIKSNNLPQSTISRIKNNIRLVIFEKFGNEYYVIDDEQVQVMYQQAALLLASGNNDDKITKEIANDLDAQEIIYGDINRVDSKIEINLTSLERKGAKIVPKSIIKLSVYESQIDAAISEMAQKLIDPSYEIDNDKIQSSESIELQKIEIKQLENGEISQILFRSDDRIIQQIANSAKELIDEGDQYLKKEKYNKAMDVYEDAIERIDNNIDKNKQELIKSLRFELLKRMKAVCIAKHNIIINEYNKEIKELEEKASKGKNIDIEDYEDIFRDYIKDLDKLGKWIDGYNKLGLSYSKITQNKDEIYVYWANLYEKKGDIAYKDLKFSEAMKAYKKAKQIFIDWSNPRYSDLYTRKLDTVRQTGMNYVYNQVQSLLDQAQYYNFKKEKWKAKELFGKARDILEKTEFPSYESYNLYNTSVYLVNLDQITNICKHNEFLSKYYSYDSTSLDYDTRTRLLSSYFKSVETQEVLMMVIFTDTSLSYNADDDFVKLLVEDGRTNALKKIVKIRQSYLDERFKSEQDSSDFEERKNRGEYDATTSLRAITYEAYNIKYNLLYPAIQAGHLDMVRFLSESKFDIYERFDYCSAESSTYLHLAADCWNIEIVKYMIDEGFDVNVQNDLNITPLHRAVIMNRYDIAEFLIANGADVNIKTSRQKQTPIFSILSSSYNTTAEKIKMCDLLLNNGARTDDILTVGSERWSLLYTIIEFGNKEDDPEFFRYLISKGAPVNVKTADNGSTVLDLAIKYGLIGIANVLVESGAKTGSEL